MITRITVILLALSSTTFAYQSSSSRRQILQQVAASAILMPAQQALAMDACPKGSKNCIRTTWTAPDGTDKGDIAKSLVAVLNEYPQAGQQDVDKGGWTIVEDDLKGSGKARVEYKSGIGNFAKFFNGGKPFVDDLSLEINGNQVEVKSSSRIGESDLGVNQKRLAFLRDKVKALGWDAPEPKY